MKGGWGVLNFLYQTEEKWPIQPKHLQITNDDKEIRRKACSLIWSRWNSILEDRVSSWLKFRRIVARVLLLSRKASKLDATMLQKAEKVILRFQSLPWCRDVERRPTIEETRITSLINTIHRRRRVVQSEEPEEIKHPIILPKQSKTTTIIIESKNWSMKAPLVRHITSNYISCRLLRGRKTTQKMTKLPADRMKEAPPFTVVGVDMFDPFHIKERNIPEKYGITFTCLCRVVHLDSR